MDISRLQIILIMGVTAFALRALPQVLFLGRKFPEAWDRLLRYLSYALICSIVALTLFMSGARFETHAAPFRAVALAITVIVARKTKNSVTGMLTGAVMISIFSWLR